jgi:hypothetical protein
MYLKSGKRAFTLVEIIVACVVLAMFMIGVYQLFIGGSKTAGRAQWITGTVDQMRNALQIISRDVRSATYPTTLFSDTFFDPCDNSDIAVPAQYYLRILKDRDPIKAPASGELKIMSWVMCEPEKPPTQPGKLVRNEIWLDHAFETPGGTVANLRIKTEAFTYTTSAQSSYAKSGNLSLSPIPEESRNRVLVNDVEYVEFSVAGTIPPEKPVDFFPISVKIRTLYPKDANVFKENSIMATPQVGIDTF